VLDGLVELVCRNALGAEPNARLTLRRREVPHRAVASSWGSRIDVGEADREDRVGLRGEELSPGRPGPSRSGIDASFLEDRLPGSASTAT
jgi:hypothetical protein